MERGEDVFILVYDERNAGHFRISPSQVVGFSYGGDGKLPHIRLVQEHGFSGMSGGGVFKNNGKLVGIIHRIDSERHDEIIASPLFYKEIDKWIPHIVCSGIPQTVETGRDM